MSIDKRHPEDLDTTGNDHAADALRYLCKARLIDSKWEQPAQVFNKGVIQLQSYIEKIRARNAKSRI
jgi:predicted DNA-binding ArsR family transcriptional regulator